MKLKNVILPLSLMILSSCSAEVPTKLEWAKDVLYIGSYSQVETTEGEMVDYFLCVSFLSGEEISEGGSKEPQKVYNLNNDNLIHGSDVPKVRYIDITDIYQKEYKRPLADLIGEGGAVEVYTSAGVLNLGDPIISGRLYLTDVGYAYSLSSFEVIGEDLTFNRQKLYRGVSIL